LLRYYIEVVTDRYFNHAGHRHGELGIFAQASQLPECEPKTVASLALTFPSIPVPMTGSSEIRYVGSAMPHRVLSFNLEET
jgi:hypothetical protein